MEEYFEFHVRTRVIYQPGLANDVGDEAARFGAVRAFVVADPGVVAAGIVDRIRASLEQRVTVVGVASDVPANSSVSAVERITSRARSHAPNLIVGVGGGSALDTAKAVRMLLSEGGTLDDYQGYNLLERPLMPLIAIPTTAGTGSEVTAWAVIRDEQAGVKLAFGSPYLAPDLALLDPVLTCSLPAALTAATGMDALTHAIESYVGRQTNVITEALAAQAVSMIANHLRAATHTGDDLEARGAMLVASCLAGAAFSSGGGSLGIVHALSHAIGGRTGAHHGTINAILLPHGMRFNAGVSGSRLARLAWQLGVNTGGRTEQVVIDEAIDAVRDLAAECDLPLRLRDVGVPYADLPTLAERSLGDAAVFTNPRPVSADDALAVLHAAW
jgi:alcohol dehydrogenase class IV